jgi:F0F1-type ATP synthase alpha subunit
MHSRLRHHREAREDRRHRELIDSMNRSPSGETSAGENKEAQRKETMTQTLNEAFPKTNAQSRKVMLRRYREMLGQEQFTDVELIELERLVKALGKDRDAMHADATIVRKANDMREGVNAQYAEATERVRKADAEFARSCEKRQEAIRQSNAEHSERVAEHNAAHAAMQQYNVSRSEFSEFVKANAGLLDE